MNISNQAVDRLEAEAAATQAIIVSLRAEVANNDARLAVLGARLDVLNRQIASLTSAQRELDSVYDELRNIMEDNNLTLIEIRQSIRALLARAGRVGIRNEVEERETVMDQ